jgi:hypothetical protein
MITSAKQIVRFTPRELCDEDGRPLPDAPVYLIEPPTLFTRAEWHRAMFDIGARQVTVTDLLATMRRGIREVVAEDQRDELLAFIEQFENSSQGMDELSESTRQIIDQHGEDSDEGKEAAAALMEAIREQADMTGRMDDLEGQMRRMFPPYGRKIGEQLFWLENAPRSRSSGIIACLKPGWCKPSAIHGMKSTKRRNGWSMSSRRISSAASPPRLATPPATRMANSSPLRI